MTHSFAAAHHAYNMSQDVICSILAEVSRLRAADLQICSKIRHITISLVILQSVVLAAANDANLVVCQSLNDATRQTGDIQPSVSLVYFWRQASLRLHDVNTSDDESSRPSATYLIRHEDCGTMGGAKPCLRWHGSCTFCIIVVDSLLRVLILLLSSYT